MRKKVYIEDINKEDFKSGKDSTKFPIKQYEAKLPMRYGEYIFEIDGIEGEKAIIEHLQNKECVEDTQLINFIKKNAPEFQKYFNQAPIELQEFKKQMRILFDDLPEQLFEGTNYLEVIKKIVNHVIKKETIDFVIKGVRSGKLCYDESVHPLLFSSFYRISKLNHHLISFKILIESWETVLENDFWKTVFSDDTEKSINSLVDIRQFYNFLGRQYTDFISKLSNQQRSLKKEREHNKRIGFVVPTGYWSEFTSTQINVLSVIKELKRQREELYERKRRIVSIIQDKKSIKKEQIDTILNGKLGIFKYKIKQWIGLYK